MELSRCLNDAHFYEAMTHHSTAATALHEAYDSNIIALEQVAKVEEGRECQAFAEAFWAVMQMCPLDVQGTFMYPLQLLTSNVPLAALMGMSTVSQLQAMEGIATTPKATPQCQRLQQYHQVINAGDSPPTEPSHPPDSTRQKMRRPPKSGPCKRLRPLKGRLAGSFL